MADEVGKKFFWGAKELLMGFFCVWQVILVSEIGDEDYLLGRRGEQKGKVPKAFLEMLED